MKTALVTGATSGVGRAIARNLARDGIRVLAVGRDTDSLAELAATAGIEPLLLDLRDLKKTGATLPYQKVDILINNAGIMPPLGSFHEAEQHDIDAAISINFAAQVALTRLLVPGMVERGNGHVIFTGSVAGHAALANMAVYCATKAALSGFAQALRLDLADHGVRVTEIVAGRIESNLYRGLLPEEQRKAMYAGGVAVQPSDVASMVRAILELPHTVDVSRFDILPARHVSPVGMIR
jgi:NADP-dependent 3-hydroxy acid dehydrogenase YdfG